MMPAAAHSNPLISKNISGMLGQNPTTSHELAHTIILQILIQVLVRLPLVMASWQHSNMLAPTFQGEKQDSHLADWLHP